MITASRLSIDINTIFKNEIAMKTGVVKWFDQEKGFGFIKVDGEDKDIFLHINDLKKINLETIAGNTSVSFEVREDKRKRQNAFNVNLI